MSFKFDLRHFLSFLSVDGSIGNGGIKTRLPRQHVRFCRRFGNGKSRGRLKRYS